MNTTNVFAELLVIGLGPLTAAILIVLIAIDPGGVRLGDVMDTASSLALIVPGLAATYILGIVVDRIADRIFGYRSKRIRHGYFEDDDQYHEARRTIIYHSEPMYRLRQYGRSRLRICRGWAMNAVLIAVPANAYMIGAAVRPSIMVVVNALLIATFAGTTFAWGSLARGEYRKVKGGAEFIRNELAATSRSGIRLHD